MKDNRAQIRKAVETDLVRILDETFKEDLASVIVYGSYADESFAPGVSDVNVLVVLEHALPARIEAFGSRAHGTLRRNRIAPLILSRQEFHSSADVFPMEYMDIAARHVVLHGRDETRELRLSRRNLRHELEHQLRGNLIRVRQLLIAARGRRRHLKDELTAWFGSMAALFRGLLRLAGEEEVPAEPRELVSRVNDVFELEPGPFLRLIDLREGTGQDTVMIAREVAERLSRLVEIVDRMEVER